MRIGDILRLAVIGALRGKIRTTLTIFASAISVAATILVLAVGVFAQDAVTEQLDALGIGGVTIYPKKVAADAGLRLSTDDAVAVMNAVDGVDNAIAFVVEYGSYAMKNWQGNAVVFGTGEGLGDALDVELLHGRFYDEGDIRASADAVVVDASFAETVYGRTNIVGKTLNLTAGATRELTVIGVISSQSAGLSTMFGGSLPSFFYVPHTTLASMSGSSGADQILIQTDSDSTVNAAVAYLGRLHASPNGLKSENISAFRGQIDATVATVSLFIVAIGAISVFIAGIGIMNTMLSTAIERRREVGIYMSLGAKSRDIILEFIAEAGAISAIGALIGAFTACFGLYFVGKVTGLDLSPDARYVVAAVLVATVCGALFGVAPAIRASKIDPIEALREG